MKKFFLFLLNFVAVLSFAAAVLATIFNLVNPWTGDEVASTSSPGYIRIPIGGSLKGDKIESRSYALLPISFQEPKMLYVGINKSGSYEVEPDAGSFWLFMGLIIYGGYLVTKYVRTKRLPDTGYSGSG